MAREIVRKLFVPITKAESDALIKLAERERRDPRAQAAILIRQSLEQLGLLDTEQEDDKKK